MMRWIWVIVAVFGIPVFALAAFGIFLNSDLGDRLAFRAIRRYCERHGCSQIEPFLNSRSSYGVSYVKNGSKLRGKCAVSPLGGRVLFEKNDPATLRESVED